MKTYYIMLHWDKGSSVSGFLAPQAKDPKDAIRLVKKSLLANKALLNSKYGKEGDSGGDYRRTVHFLKSLKRPWRDCNRYKKNKTVVVTELIGVVDAGYWLTDTITRRHICNQVDRTSNQF